MSRPRLRHILLALAVLLAAFGDERLATTAPGPPGDGGPLEILAGVFLIDLVRVDAADQSVEADFMLTLSWSDPRLAHDSPSSRVTDTIWQPRIVSVQGRRFLSVVWEDLSVDREGTVLLRKRYAGPLSVPLNLAAFPFDRHVIKLSFTIPGASASDIRFVVNESRSGRAQTLTVADWKVGTAQVTSDPYEIPGMGIRLPGFSFEIGVERHRGFYVWGVLMPLVVIIAMSWAVFWLSTSFVGQKMSIATTSILTLIAYRFALGTQLPRLSYLTRMDYFMVGATILVFLAFLQVVIEAGLVHAGRETMATRIDRICRWGFPAALAGLLYGSFGL